MEYACEENVHRAVEFHVGHHVAPELDSKVQISTYRQLPLPLETGSFDTVVLYGVLELAINLLASSKQRQVSRAVRNLTVPEPEKRELPPDQEYWQEMTERFTEWMR